MNDSKECAYWVKFFKQAEIPEEIAEDYAVKFVDHRIHKSILGDLTREVLVEMGIKAMGDVIAIMKHSKKVALEVEASRSRRQLTSTMKQNINTSPAKAAASKPEASGKSEEVKKGISKKKVIVIKKTPKMVAAETESALLAARKAAADKTKQDKIMRQVSKNNNNNKKKKNATSKNDEDDDDSTVFDRLGPQRIADDDDDVTTNTVTSRIEKMKRRSAPVSSSKPQQVKRVISARDADVIKKLKLATNDHDVIATTYTTLRSDVTHDPVVRKKRVASSKSVVTSSSSPPAARKRKSGGVFGRLGTAVGSQSGAIKVEPSSKPKPSIKSRLGASTMASVKTRLVPNAVTKTGTTSKMASHGIFASERSPPAAVKKVAAKEDVFARLGGRRR